MPSPIIQTVDALRALIAQTTPDQEPTWPWVLCEGDLDLESAQLDGDETLRLFEVLGDVQPAFSDWSGSLAMPTQRVDIHVRYHCPRADGGYRRARDLAAADAAQLAYLVATNETEIGVIEAPSLAGGVRRVGAHSWLLRLQIEVRYEYGGD